MPNESVISCYGALSLADGTRVSDEENVVDRCTVKKTAGKSSVIVAYTVRTGRGLEKGETGYV